ncbi:phage shock protein PspA [compost metagenome]
MQKTMSKTDMGSAMANFERMSSRIETMEAEANARVSLQTPDIDADFRKLSRNADVEAELQSLKAKLAQ